MKIYISKSKRLIISFFLIFILAASGAYCKDRDTKVYKSRAAACKNTERVNWKWWKKFEDPLLLNALEQSLKNNFDVLIADLKTQEAENYISSSRRSYLPSVQMGASYMDAASARIDSFGRVRFYGKSQEKLIYMPLEFSYELDFWGKKEDEISYFKSNKDFTELEKNFIILITVSDVSMLYFNILKNEKLIALYEQIQDLKEKKLGINLEKYEYRLVSKSKIIEIKKELNVAEEELTTIKAQNEELKNQFYLLVSGDKEKIPVKFQNIEDIRIFYNKELEINTSHIANRPDVLMAENQIKMAKLDVKMAKKALLPNFLYKGDISHVSRLFNNLFHSESLTYRIGYGIFYDLLKKGNNLSGLKAKKSIYKQTLKAYEKAIVSSITDVNNSLIHLKSSVINYNQAKGTSLLDQENLEIEREKLDLNLIAREDFMDSQEKFIRSKILEYESKTQCLIHSISLYKALGGNV